MKKNAIRLVSLDPQNSHCASIFKSLNIFNNVVINKLQVGCFMYKYLNVLLPLSFTDYYIRKSTIHMINIRNSHDLYRIF